MKSQEFKGSEFQELSELKVTFTCVLQRAFTYTSELVNYTSVLFTYNYVASSVLASIGNIAKVQYFFGSKYISMLV